jgi:hypothetical protein
MGYINTVNQFMMIVIITFRVNDNEGNNNKLIFLKFRD